MNDTMLPMQLSRLQEKKKPKITKNTPHLPNITIEDQINHHEAALKHLYRTQGKHYDPIANLCRQVGVKKRYLAFGLIMQAKGKLTVAELARRLRLDRANIYRWPEIIRAVKIR